MIVLYLLTVFVAIWLSVCVCAIAFLPMVFQSTISCTDLVLSEILFKKVRFMC